MGFSNKVNRLKHGDVRDIGQYRYTFNHIRTQTGDKNMPTVDTKYWSVIVNAEYLSKNEFDPYDLPLGKVEGYSVTNFRYLYTGLGYQRLIKFNSSKIKSQHKKSEQMFFDHMFDDMNCDVLDIRGCEPRVFVKIQTPGAGIARVIVVDYASLDRFRDNNWVSFNNFLLGRTIIANTEKTKEQLGKMMFTEEVKVKHLEDLDELIKFISKVKMLMLKDCYLLVV